MKVDLNFITPIFTAKTINKSRFVEPTAILGGLRWWYEALIRAQGGFACDISDKNNRCPQPMTYLSITNYQQHLCPVCQLFGSTGWRRRFDLQVYDQQSVLSFPPTAANNNVLITENFFSKHVFAAIPGTNGYRYYPGRSGSVKLRFNAKLGNPAAYEPVLILLLAYIQEYAGLGACLNRGYGLFEFPDPLNGLENNNLNKLLAAQISNYTGTRTNLPGLPNAHDCFCWWVSLPNAYTPVSFANFKRNLRTAFVNGPLITGLIPGLNDRRDYRHYFLGTINKPIQASKVKLALLPDRRTLKIWGWIRDYSKNGISLTRADTLSIIENYLTAAGLPITRKVDSLP